MGTHINDLAPIALFVYNRPWHTHQTVEALQCCELAVESDLYIFADGPKNNATEEQKAQISEVRHYIHTIDGFHSVTVEESETNNGLANSVISGVTKVIEKYSKVIVLEDDIVAHPFFLRFMNEALDFYKHDSRIFMIGGCRLKFKIPWWYFHDIYILHRSCSWGWATWKERWSLADWNISDYNSFINNRKEIELFCRGGQDMIYLLQQQINGIIDSWAIRWDYCMYKHNGFCLWPINSLVNNIGFDYSGVHCSNNSKIEMPSLNKKKSIKFVKNIAANNTLSKSFFKFCNSESQPVYSKRVKIFAKQIIKKIKGQKWF
jgi:hypothetical protein